MLGTHLLVCDESLFSKPSKPLVTNLRVTQDNATEVGDLSRCAPVNPAKPATFVFVIDPALNRSISSITVKYLMRGPSGTITIEPVGRILAGSRTPTVIRQNATALGNATTTDSDGVTVWAPGVTVVALPSLPDGVSLAISQGLNSEVQLVSVLVTTAAKPTPTPGRTNVKRPPTIPTTKPPANWVPPTPAEVMNSVNNASNGRRLLGGASFTKSLRSDSTAFIAGSVGGLAGAIASGLVTKEAVMGNYIKSWRTGAVGSTQCYRHSYNRGVGDIPSHCSGWENIAGICYEWCRSNYYGVSFVCWEHCPGGWQDHGVTCHIPMHSYWNSDRGWCGWWDVCATWSRTDCRTCDSGYRRDGCICTRDPRWHTKHTYTRSSRLPGCGGHKPQWQNGLCYANCNTGYWGESFLCYNNCPDAFPHSCGIGLCTKDAKACEAFVLGSIKQVASLAASVAGAVAAGAFTGGWGAAPVIAGVLKTAAETALHFMGTPVCADTKVHLTSNMAVMTIDNRDFSGTDIGSEWAANYDDCLLKCSRRWDCEFVVYGKPWNACWMKRSPGDGPNGANYYNPNLQVGVAIMRVREERINFQWASTTSELPGAVLEISPGQNRLQHWDDRTGSNLALCHLSCMGLRSCTHFVHTTKFCWFRNARAGNQGISYPEQFRGSVVDMAKWENFDA